MLKKIYSLKDKNYIIDKELEYEYRLWGEHQEIRETIVHKVHTFFKSNNKLILEKVRNVLDNNKVTERYKYEVKLTIKTTYYFTIFPLEDKIKYIDTIKNEKKRNSKKSIFIKILANDILSSLGESISNYKIIEKKGGAEIISKVESARKLNLIIYIHDTRNIRYGGRVIITQIKELKNYF